MSKELLQTTIQANIDILNKEPNGGRLVAQISDGYHTFDELYEFRKMYNAVLFNGWAIENSYETRQREGYNEMSGEDKRFTPNIFMSS